MTSETENMMKPMRGRAWAWLAGFCVGLSFLAGGCAKKGNEPKIIGSSGDPAVEMPWSWNISNRYNYRFDSITSSEVPGRAMIRTALHETTFGQEHAVTVTELMPSGARHLQMEITSVKFDASRGDDTTMSFDSEFQSGGFDESRLTEAFQRVKGGRIGFEVSPSNSVVRVDGLKEFYDRLGMNRARGTNGPARGGATSLRSIFSQQFFKEMIELNVLPDKAVRIGESWNAVEEIVAGHSINSNGHGTFVADLTCTFRGWQERETKKCALIEFKGTIANKPRGGGILKNFAGGAPDIQSGTIGGRSWYYPDWSQPIETYYDMRYVYTFSDRRVRNPAPGTNSVSQTQNLTNTMNIHANLKLIDVIGAR